MLQERSGVYKPPTTMKKLKLEGTDSRKCECPIKICGYFEKKTNDWWLSVLIGVHNHDLGPKLGVHLAGRLREKEKKKVLCRNILMDLKEKK